MLVEKQAFRIAVEDNVAIVTGDSLQPGDLFRIDDSVFEAREAVPFGHKIALCDIPKDSHIIKYGFPIGKAVTAISKGEWVHFHNICTELSVEEEYSYVPAQDNIVEENAQTFWGYERANGTVGIRNEIWILPMVSCVNHTAEMIVSEYKKRNGENHAVFALSQPYGCSQLGTDHSTTVQILRDIAMHPNAGGVILLSLGCENNVMADFIDGLPQHDPARIRPLRIQDSVDEIAEGVRMLEELVELASYDVRTEQPFSKLHIGFKCGASDAFSGITANPLCGRICELLVKAGAGTVLTEVPEMFGAERILMSRACNEAVFHQIVKLINDFKEYYIRCNQPIYENPSPGNKEGGITTLEEKSLGCIQKGGNCRVDNVATYSEVIHSSGLTLLASPGNDPVSITALACSGCQLLLFTTGRGNPLGSIVPTIKIASNSVLAERKKTWIDFNAGRLLAGEEMDDLVRELLSIVLSAVNGEYITKSEIAGYKEIGIFKDGVIL